MLQLPWFSPNGRDKNQIDHRHMEAFPVRVKRGADVGSARLLVTARIQQNSTETEKGRPPTSRRFEVNRLDDPAVKKSFLVQLKNRYQALAEQGDHTNNNVDEIDSLWKIVKTSYQEAGEQVMGHSEKKHKDWISQEAWQVIQETSRKKNTRNKIRPT